MLDIQQKLINEKIHLDWLGEFQAENKKRWSSQHWPTRKTESWKYSPLRAIEDGAYAPASDVVSTTLNPEVVQAIRAKLTINEFDTHDIAFVDGKYSAEFSSAESVPEGLEFCLFAEASSSQQEKIRKHLDTIVNREQHFFVSQNGGQLTDGVFINVEKNAVVKKPVRLLWITTRQASSTALTQRLLVTLGENSQATLMEQFISTDEEQNSFTNGVSEFLLQDNSKLFHYRLHQEQENSALVSGVHARLMRSANLESFYLAFGGALKRLDIVVDHRGEGAHCEMNGVYLPRNKQHVDFHTCIEHAVPHCTTNEVFRGIVGDSAKAVFNGRIHIHKNAQKTLAQLSNKNLLTSHKAEVDTKPELEIYADDVQCAHGATVAQLDETALHYLKTRGVSSEEAKVMLSFGFINELVDHVSHQAVANYLRPILARRFAKEPELMRHIAE